MGAVDAGILLDEQADFIGFVTQYTDTPADEFLLTRYVVSRCVADATVAQVRVVNVTPGAFEDSGSRSPARSTRSDAR